MTIRTADLSSSDGFQPLAVPPYFQRTYRPIGTSTCNHEAFSRSDCTPAGIPYLLDRTLTQPIACRWVRGGQLGHAPTRMDRSMYYRYS